MRLAALGLAALLIALALAMGGAAPFGRVALALGAPRLAAQLFADPGWRGAALYRAGAYDEAADAFAAGGPDAAYNLGDAEVRRGRYAAALEAFDLAMAHRPDPAAQVNFDLVLAFYAGTRLDAGSIARWGQKDDGASAAADVAKGSARASGEGDEVTNTGATVGLPELRRGVVRSATRKVFDDKFVTAGPRWLATLEDAPGAFLSARIAHERKRREKAGEGQPELETEW